jgi:hypothetical protein
MQQEFDSLGVTLPNVCSVPQTHQAFVRRCPISFQAVFQVSA